MNESREDFTAAGERDPLRPRRGEGRRLEGDRGDPRRPRSDGPFTGLARLLPARARPAGEPARDREPDQVRRLRLDRAQPRPPAGRRSTTCCAGPGCARRSARAPSWVSSPAATGASSAAAGAARRSRRGAAKEELQRERETLGFFITGHPLDRYEKDLRRFTNVTVGDAAHARPGAAAVAVARRAPGRTAPGPARRRDPHRPAAQLARRATATPRSCSRTREGVVEVIAWPDTYRRHETVVAGGAPVVVTGGARPRPTSAARSSPTRSRASTPRAPRRSGRCTSRCRSSRSGARCCERLRDVLAEHPGPCQAFLHLLRPGTHARPSWRCPRRIRVAASAEVLDAVERVLGAGMLSFR